MSEHTSFARRMQPCQCWTIWSHITDILMGCWAPCVYRGRHPLSSPGASICNLSFQSVQTSRLFAHQPLQTEVTRSLRFFCIFRLYQIVFHSLCVQSANLKQQHNRLWSNFHSHSCPFWEVCWRGAVAILLRRLRLSSRIRRRLFALSRILTGHQLSRL